MAFLKQFCIISATKDVRELKLSNILAATQRKKSRNLCQNSIIHVKMTDISNTLKSRSKSQVFTVKTERK